MYTWFATMPLGIEDVSRDEIAEIANCSPGTDIGRVFFTADLEAMYRVNYMARTVNRLYLLLARERFGSLNDIYRIARSLDYTLVLKPEATFAVRCERIGEHPFTSIDVAKVVGQAVIDSYMDSKGVRLRVNLDRPDVEISVFVRFDEVLIGVNTTGDSLHKRKYRVYNHPAALKATLASAMLRIGGYAAQPLLDPLCGGATIPIEAAHMARKYPISMFRDKFSFTKLPIHDPEMDARVREELLSAVNNEVYQLCCMDVSVKHLRGAIDNAKSAKVADTIKFLLGDATRRESYGDLEAELIVTNPPYGMRSHNLKKIELFYRDLLIVLRELYSGKKLVLITASKKQFESAASNVGVEICNSRKVMHGGLLAKIYVIKL